ncbi:MAG: GNAT family N-acetyltransferase [Nitrospinae bacterium]|nr:GNAT family N-acetyltransferase [Nitrospinota bacterium]
MSGIIVRDARREDVPAIADLLAELYSIESQFTPRPEKQREGIRLALENPQLSRLLVAQAGGRVIGFANLQLMVSTYHGAITVHIDDFIIASANRGGGAGRTLMDGVLAKARELGAPRVTVNIDKANTQAYAFYGKMGFMAMDMERWQRAM